MQKCTTQQSECLSESIGIGSEGRGLKPLHFEKVYINCPPRFHLLIISRKAFYFIPVCINTHSLLPAGFGIKQGAVQRSGLQEDISKYEYIITTAKRGCGVGHIPREMSRICSNVWHHHTTHPELQFKNSSMRCLNRLWLLFHSLCCTTRCIFESMHTHTNTHTHTHTFRGQDQFQETDKCNFKPGTGLWPVHLV